MNTLIRKASGLALIASIALTPAFALADSDKGKRGDDERSALRQSGLTVRAASNIRLSSNADRDHDNSGPGSANSGRGSIEKHHDDDECVERHESRRSSSLLSVLLRDRDDDDDCDAATTTSDTIAPVLSAIVATTGTTSAMITWTTDEPSTSRVAFSASTTPFARIRMSANDPKLVTNHSVRLSGLKAGTTYRFVVRSADASRNVATSGRLSFTTQSAAVATAPVVSAVAATASVSTSTISWTTDTPAAGTVFFGTADPLDVNATTTLSLTNPALLTNHSFSLTGLTASTTYHFIVRSINAVGATMSSVFSFLTMADTTAPVLNSVATTVTASTTAAVTWTTSEPASSKVSFSTTTPVNLATAPSVSTSALVTNHSITLPGLTASTTYFAIAQSTDASDNTAASSQISFTTPVTP